MKLAARDRRAVTLGAVLLGTLLVVNYVVMPLADSWAEADRRAEDARDQLRKTENRVRRVLGQRRRLAKVYGPAVNQPLGDTEAARADLEATQEIFKAAGLKNPAYDQRPPRPVREVPGIDRLQMQVQGKCNFRQFTKCLAGLRKAPTLVIVDHFTITNDLKKPGQLDVTLVISTLATARRVPPSPARGGSS